jgi:hypothetical protein
MRFSSRALAGLILGLAISSALSMTARPVRAQDAPLRVDAGGRLQFRFDSEPHMVPVPNRHSFYAQDVQTADMYRLNDSWFTFYQDNWYRADTYRGPWTRNNSDGIPAELQQLPNGYYHFNHANRDQNQLDQNRRDQNNRDQNNRDQASRDQANRDQVNRDQDVRDQANRDQINRDQAARDQNDRDQHKRDMDASDAHHEWLVAHDGSRILIASEPRMYQIPRSDMTYARDYRGGELYQIGSNWYINYGGNWYGATTYAGPWSYLETRNVPSRVASVPHGYYRSLRMHLVPVHRYHKHYRR